MKWNLLNQYHFTDHHQFRPESFEGSKQVHRTDKPDGQIDRKSNAGGTETFRRRNKSKRETNEEENQRDNI